MPNEQQTKACPYCAETILARAVKCKHCGEFLDGARAGPAATPPRQVVVQPSREGLFLRMMNLGCAVMLGIIIVTVIVAILII